MIRENQKLLNRLQVFLDSLIIVISLIIAFYIRFWEHYQGVYIPVQNYLKALVVIVPFYIFLYSLFGLYVPQRTKSRTIEAINIIKANGIGLMILITILFTVKQIDYSRYVLLFFGGITVVLTIAMRITLRKILRHIRKQGFNQKHILVIGARRLAQHFTRRVRANRALGYNVIGYLDDFIPVGTEVEGYKVLGTLEKLEEILEEHQLDEIIIALSLKEYDKLKHIIAVGEKVGVKVQIVPGYMKYIPAKPSTDEIDGLPIINIRHVPLDNVANKLVKRAFDIIVSLICILIFGPLMLFVALAIKITSPGPIIFKQERMGLNRKNFNMYKFRSMKMQTAEEEKVQWTTKDDPRKTKIGEFIRKTSIDELPQLFNVLFGDMSLVGPRPERPFFVDQFKETIPRYMIKHQVRPGITGWAQVNGWRGDTSIEERINCDLYYIENWTLALDFKILILTVTKGFVNPNAY